MVLLLALLVAPQATSPLDFAKREIAQIAGPRAGDVELVVRPSRGPESYAITSDGSKVRIEGGDAVGAMYGAFEFAERLRDDPVKAWTTKAEGKPYLPERGLNLFLTLPWNYAKNDTEYDPAALVDPDRWWFQNDDYWTSLLDLMAHSRLNWLDIHGTWDISVTDAPNLYAYFVTAPSFQKVGVSPEIKAANLARLNQVIAMAHARGIRVSLMAYQASLKIPQNPDPPYEGTEANVYAYTREAVEQMIRKAPGLDAIGFRIGESGHGGSFFTCYGEAVKNSGRDIPLITRSWVTRRQSVLPLARASKDFTVEIKYNGEHWGAPYMVAGGRVANWYSYSFEDYLSDPGSPATNARTWPGWPAASAGSNAPQGADGPTQGRWPGEPYKIVWQVRANGTHRIFPFYNPEWVRRSIRCMKIGTASGYTIEGEDAYYPKRPDYYMADPEQKGYRWIHQRDAMYWTTWGRLGYDPSVADDVFDRQAARMLGEGSRPLVEAWKQASPLVSRAFMALSLGPDHRSHAPELEWGGDLPAIVQGQGFDTHGFLPINERIANHETGGIDGRIDAKASADALSTGSFDRAMLDAWTRSPSKRASELALHLLAMLDRAEFAAARLRAADDFAWVENVRGHGTLEGLIGSNLRRAMDAHRRLAQNPLYRPFTERLRMHTNTFAWSEEQKKLDAEWKRLQGPLPEIELVGSEERKADLGAGTLSWKAQSNKVVCTFECPEADRAWLLVKALPSSTFFHRVPMVGRNGRFTAEFPRERWGHALAVEAVRGELAARFPNPEHETPYLVVPSQPGTTPQIYSAEEAMAYLKPEILEPARYGGLLLGTRAWRFFNGFDRATQRKLLAPIERGTRLVILQQDFNKYKLDWLPKPLKFESGNWGVFDPGGQLGLPKVETADVMWQRFLPSDGWDVFGNGGLARLKLGKGEVWVTSARLMQRMHIASAAKAFVTLLGLGGKEKPTVLIDSNSEGADYSSSNHPDLMNAHDIPFLTLGEAIAKEQGLDSKTVVPGPVLDDDVLEGQGPAVVAAYQRGKVVQAARRTPPADRGAFETERSRRRTELMRSLGLDPMPERTPLNARVTGVLQRDGYRIEKVVFESRPRFYVTAHVYVPRPELGSTTGRFPVIVNVNGHWAHKKDEDRVQLRCAFEALRGYLAIAIDSPGHSFEGDSLIERRAEGEHNDWFLVQGGLNATGVYVWDAMRALDYAATRPDADMARVGLTGASGGGLATLYAFAADDRYQAAVPVVYMASMELAPDNGCLCNHVPATLQIGDRSDVMAIQAPKPVLLMGAENDGEFPAEATRLTGEKMRREWGLFGASDAVQTRIFPGGHDYSKPMREAMIGFFDRALRGVGDGAPVPEPPIQVFGSEDRQLLVLPDPPADERTMRDLARGALASPGRLALLKVNGGLPSRGDLKYAERGAGAKRTIVFESEPGLRTPGVLVLPEGRTRRVRIVVDDRGKAAALAERAGGGNAGEAVLYLDTLGLGELSQVNLRYAIYLGTAVPYTAGWQIVRATEAMRKYGAEFVVDARGPLASMAALDAALMAPGFARIEASGGLRSWEDVFDGSPNPLLVQPRANLLPTLGDLRRTVPDATWR